MTDFKPVGLLVVLLLLSTVAPAQDSTDGDESEIDYFSSENILKFADHLYVTGDYGRAAGEYQRYLIAVSFEPSSDSIYYKTIRALFFGNDYKLCEDYLDSYHQYYPGSARLADIDLLRAIVYNRQGDYEKSIEYASDVKAGNLPLKSLVLSADYTQLGKFEKARELSCSFAGTETITPSPTTTQLDNLCSKLSSRTLKYKSPLLASSLAIIPGAGKLYCGHAGDALNSFLLIGLFGYLAYDGFHDDGESSVRGWIFGTLGFGFYAGNIYGSAIAAKLYNKKVKDDFILGLDIDVSMP